MTRSRSGQGLSRMDAEVCIDAPSTSMGWLAMGGPVRGVSPTPSVISNATSVGVSELPLDISEKGDVDMLVKDKYTTSTGGTRKRKGSGRLGKTGEHFGIDEARKRAKEAQGTVMMSAMIGRGKGLSCQTDVPHKREAPRSVGGNPHTLHGDGDENEEENKSADEWALI